MAFSQSYLDFDQYQRSVKIKIKKSESLPEVIKRFNYKKPLKDVLQATMDLNGFIRFDLKHLDKRDFIYLPPTISFQEYLDNKNQGSQLHSKLQEREVAYIQNTEVPAENATDKKKSKFKLTAGLLYGDANLTKTSTKLSFNFIKTVGKISYITESKYTLSASIGITKYTGITYTESLGSYSSDSIYPEFSLSFGKFFGGFGLNISYDYMNYLILNQGQTTIALSTQAVQRVSLKPFIPINESWGVFAGAGYLVNLGGTKVSGIDYSAGANYRFGENKRFGASALYYKSSLDVGDASTSEAADAWALGISIDF